MTFDLVVRNGVIVDGSGMPRYRADVGVRDGRIAAIGRIRDRGREEIDAEGHVVTPGFVDGHTHMDAQLMWDPLGTSSCYQGVTTVVMGNCGFTLAPVHDGEQHLVVRNLERAEAISADAMAKGITWSWEAFPEYLDVVDRLPKGINYAVYIGHSALRTWVMGERAFTETASEDDLAAMRRGVREAMHAGAIGFSTSRSMHHQTADDRPVASRLASWDEVRQLTEVLSEVGTGVMELALEEGARSTDPREREEFARRMREVAVSTGVPITFGVLPTLPDGADWRDLLALIDGVADAGGRMFGQSHSRGPSVLLSFETVLPFDRLPVWSEIRTLPLAAQEKALRDGETRQRLVEIARSGPYGRALGAEARAPEYDRILVLDDPVTQRTTVAELARARGVDPVDAMIDLALETGMRQLFVQPVSQRDPEDLLEIMRHPRTVMTFSDSGAHVSQIMDSSIHTHLLSHWVREREAFTLEQAVRMLTLVPSLAWNLPDRGLVRVGMAADLNVFDPATVGPAMPSVVHDLPGGAVRLLQRSTGILATIVNGQVLLEGGEHTGQLPGRLVRGAAARSPERNEQ